MAAGIGVMLAVVVVGYVQQELREWRKKRRNK